MFDGEANDTCTTDWQEAFDGGDGSMEELGMGHTEAEVAALGCAAAMASGTQPGGYARWHVAWANGLWHVACGLWPLARSLWANGLWHVACGLMASGT